MRLSGFCFSSHITGFLSIRRIIYRHFAYIAIGYVMQLIAKSIYQIPSAVQGDIFVFNLINAVCHYGFIYLTDIAYHDIIHIIVSLFRP